MIYFEEKYFYKKIPGNYPKRNGILPGVAGLLWTIIGWGRGKPEEERANIELISETDYKQFRTAALWPMRRHGANGKRRVPPCGDLF